jgi:hypothetical protein
MLSERATYIAKRLAGTPSLPKLFLLLKRKSRSTHLRHCELPKGGMISIMLLSPIESTAAYFAKENL